MSEEFDLETEALTRLAAGAGMPFDLLRDQLGHTSVKQTEKYCRFHPDYNDVARYFEAMSQAFGLAAGPQGQSRDSAQKTATN